MLSGNNLKPKGALRVPIPTYVDLFTNISFFCLVVQCKNSMILGNSIQQDSTLRSLKLSKIKGQDNLITFILNKRSLWCFMYWISKHSIGQTGERKTFQAMMISVVISAPNLAICSYLEVSKMVENAMNFFILTSQIRVMKHCQKIVQTRIWMMSDHVRDRGREWFVMKIKSNSTYLVVWKTIISR